MKVLKEKHISYSSSKKPLKNQKTKRQQEAEMAVHVFSKLAKMAMKGISENESSDDGKTQCL